jgi:PAS domain S-box-containing protein
MRWWPRTIRWQMLAGLAVLEVLSLGVFGTLLIRQQTHQIDMRARERLAFQASSVALQAREALQQQRPGWVGLSVKMMGEAPDVDFAKVTDPAGNVLFVSKGEPDEKTLEPVELAQIRQAHQEEARVFSLSAGRWESVKAIYTGGDLRGFAWVESDRDWEHGQIGSILHATLLLGLIWIVASALLIWLMARSISRPLAILHRGTRALMRSPEGSGSFPLPVAVQNEIGDLIEAFNRMVASLAEQRAGLNDTLSLLDSMLANAIVGLVFLDQDLRVVRVNSRFSSMTGVPLSHHLGRTLPELLPLPVAQELVKAVRSVFAGQEPVHNLEINGQGSEPGPQWTWLVNAYPVRTTPLQVRWVGVIILDASDRKRSEEALRRSEKLAATGRLAASIAHEINNPLEAVTNLLFLLRNYCQLQEPALKYAEMADHEVQRITEITQQTLRFYRQSTLPTHATMAELLDNVLSLHQGRLNTLNIQVERDYDPEMALFCFAGEIRQVIANLVGNAIDATSKGGRLVLRARRSRNWADPTQTGVRFVVADTGIGMEPAVRERVFEAFFTTKEQTGTGLGLWVSHGIIVKHGGLVHVRSYPVEQGQPSQGRVTGTVFQLFIPDGAQLAAAEEAAPFAEAS